MKKIAIHGREIKDDSVEHIKGLFQLLLDRSVEVILSRQFKEANCKHIDTENLATYSKSRLDKTAVDFVVSIGGDGTLLETQTHVGDQGIPILGINTGRLGFLATTSKENIAMAIDKLFAGDFKIEERALVQLETSVGLFGDRNYALNEFAILRRDTSSMITVHCYWNGDYLNSYWADGIMVSTPTGSTGYSLSCGGPILMPSSKNFLLTPVSPHNLNIRPIVIPDGGELTFEVDSREANLLLSLDSRSIKVDPNIEIKVKKAGFSARLVSLEGSFVETLRNKLGWGYDKRN